MRGLRKVFYNPPQGGNGRGVPTINPMASFTPTGSVQQNPSGPSPGYREYQGSTRFAVGPPLPGPSATNPLLRGDFGSGVSSARLSIVEARHAGAQDMRNFSPGSRPAQATPDPSPVSAYDYEVLQNNRPQAPRQRVTPVLEPDTRASYQTNGKPNTVMPR
jgi:hypothetical protein